MCSPESIGVNASERSFVAALDGNAPGETFIANDTLIRSISVWRVAPEANDPDPMKLWITAVDSTGMPLTDSVVFDGPAIQATGDGVSPTEVRYSFSPPISLPHRGQYFLAIQEPCYGYFDLVTTVGNAYAGGNLWRTGRSLLSGCILQPNPDSFAPNDLVFTIVFCGTSTPVRRGTWGDLKVLYR